MTKIHTHLASFTESLTQKKTVICKPNGNWHIETKKRTVFQRFFFKNKHSEENILRAYRQFLAKVEQRDLFIEASEEKNKEQTKFYSEVLQGSRAVVDYTAKSKDKRVVHLRKEIELASIKLKYLIGKENGGYDPKKVADPKLIQLVTEKVNNWMKKDEKFQFVQKKEYQEKIAEICTYAKIVKFLQKEGNDFFEKSFFQTALRDNYSVQALSEYHFESEILCRKVFMGRRIGALARRDILSIDKERTSDNCTQKKLNLLMENRKINLLDKKQLIQFSNGMKWTLAKIYRDFANKNDDPGELEVLWNGVQLFNAHKCSSLIPKRKEFWARFKLTKFFIKQRREYQPIDTTKENWFEKLPVLDIRTADYIKKRYNVEPIEGQWVAVLEASRTNELDVDKAHGYSVFFQPIGNGNYRVYSFGAFPLKFPKNIIELFNFVGKTGNGTVAHDTNNCFSHRQKASKAFVVDEIVGRALLKELGVRKAIGVAFQLGWENCAFFIRNVFVKVFKDLNTGITVPEYFKYDFLQAKPKGALKSVQTLFKILPQSLHSITKVFLKMLFRASREHYTIENGHEIKKSLSTTPFFKELEVNLPSAWHHHIKEDRLQGTNEYADCVLNYGH